MRAQFRARADPLAARPLVAETPGKVPVEIMMPEHAREWFGYVQVVPDLSGGESESEEAEAVAGEGAAAAVGTANEATVDGGAASGAPKEGK